MNSLTFCQFLHFQGVASWAQNVKKVNEFIDFFDMFLKMPLEHRFFIDFFDFKDFEPKTKFSERASPGASDSAPEHPWGLKSSPEAQGPNFPKTIAFIFLIKK